MKKIEKDREIIKIYGVIYFIFFEKKNKVVSLFYVWYES